MNNNIDVKSNLSKKKTLMSSQGVRIVSSIMIKTQSKFQHGFFFPQKHAKVSLYVPHLTYPKEPTMQEFPT